MRHGISRCACLVAAIALGAVSFSAAQTPGPGQIIGRTVRAARVERAAPAPRATTPPQCNRASASRSGGVSATRSGARPRYQPLLYPVLPQPWNFGYQPTYDPRYYPRYSPSYYPNYYPSEEEEIPRTVRVSTYADKKRAGELIVRGDASFVRRSYVSAIARYREAIRLAPDLAQPRLRVALALIAQRKYPAAVAALFEALEVEPGWRDSRLELDQLYAPDELAKTTEVLTRLVERKPMNGQLALVLGVQLFFSGQRERAEIYFTRAAQLGVDKDDRLSVFRSVGEVARAPW